MCYDFVSRTADVTLVATRVYWMVDRNDGIVDNQSINIHICRHFTWRIYLGLPVEFIGDAFGAPSFCGSFRELACGRRMNEISDPST